MYIYMYMYIVITELLPGEQQDTIFLSNLFIFPSSVVPDDHLLYPVNNKLDSLLNPVTVFNRILSNSVGIVCIHTFLDGGFTDHTNSVTKLIPSFTKNGLN